MKTIPPTIRRQLERTVADARDVAEEAARAALQTLAVGEREPYSHLDSNQRHLRRRLCLPRPSLQAVLQNPATRHCARTRLGEALADLKKHGKRVLVGFDFPFGYPHGTALALGLPSGRLGAKCGASSTISYATDRTIRTTDSPSRTN